MMTKAERPDSGSDPTDDELARVAAEAAEQTAKDLVAAGFDEAWADGPHVYARKGRYRYAMHNDVRRGPPGNREKMLDLYAAMVVRNLLNRKS